MAISKRTPRTGMYPDDVERNAVAFLRSLHRAVDSHPGHPPLMMQGDVFKVAHGVLIHVAHQLYDGYPDPLAEDPPRARRVAVPVVTARKVWDRDGWECQHCGTHCELTVDHIVPVSKGGSDDMSNYQTLCGPCNSRKGNR